MVSPVRALMVPSIFMDSAKASLVHSVRASSERATADENLRMLFCFIASPPASLKNPAKAPAFARIRRHAPPGDIRMIACRCTDYPNKLFSPDDPREIFPSCRWAARARLIKISLRGACDTAEAMPGYKAHMKRRWCAK